MTATYDRGDVKAGACSYILMGLLQRLDAQSHGLIDGLMKGVEGDFEAVRSQGEALPLVAAIFQEAQAILRRASRHGQPSVEG